MKKLTLIVGLALLISGIFSCKDKAKSTTNSNTTKTQGLKSEKEVFNIDLLLQSALDGKLQTLKNAIEKGFDVNTIDSNKRTAIMLAAFNGHTEIVDLLIENGANVNMTDNLNRTALIYASTGPFVPTVTSLLNAGAKPNIVDNQEKWTAVMMAASEGQLEVVKTLVANGADLKMVDIDGESSLDFANSKGHKEVAKYIKSQLK